jgi:hypothetical protein
MCFLTAVASCTSLALSAQQNPAALAKTGDPPEIKIPKPTDARPISEIDLWKLPPAPGAGRGGVGSKSQLTFGFANNDSIFVSWWVKDTDIPRPTKGPDPNRYHLHVSRVAFSTGKELASHDWPTSNIIGTSYEAVAEGNFLTCADGRFHLYSSNFEEVREAAVPGGTVCGSQALSADRRFILLSSGIRKEKHHNSVVDTMSLETVAAWEDDSLMWFPSLSDHRVAAQLGNQRQFSMRSVDGPWIPVNYPSATPSGPSQSAGGDYLLNDDADVFIAPDKLVVRSSGAALFEVETPYRHFYSMGRASRNGQRFTVTEAKELRSNQFLDIGDFSSEVAVLVFDVSQRKGIFNLKVKGSGEWPFGEEHSNQIAISPDGNFLAVATDEILRVYKLPPAQK